MAEPPNDDKHNRLSDYSRGKNRRNNTMNAISSLKALGRALLLFGLAAAPLASAKAQGKVQHRDFQDWLQVQTSQFAFVNNPDINGDEVDDGPRYIVAFDYAHLRAPNIGTVSGTVTVRPTVDGREDVTVKIVFEDIFLRIFALNPNGSVGPLVLGCQLADIANGATPALVTGMYTLNFLQDAGASFGNFRDVSTRGDWYGFTLVLHGEGLFTAAFDPEIEAGTVGRLQWGKPFVTTPANPNADNGAAALYPNDELHLFPIGRR